MTKMISAKMNSAKMSSAKNTNGESHLDYDKHSTQHSSDLTLKENRSSCRFVNPEKIELNKITVDGGLITTAEYEKCDYIVHWLDSNVVFVELKGSDIPKAFKQVEQTIALTKNRFVDFKSQQCAIVCSRMRMPKNDTTMIRLKRKMKDLTGSKPIIKSQQHNYTVTK